MKLSILPQLIYASVATSLAKKTRREDGRSGLATGTPGRRDYWGDEGDKVAKITGNGSRSSCRATMIQTFSRVRLWYSKEIEDRRQSTASQTEDDDGHLPSNIARAPRAPQNTPRASNTMQFKQWTPRRIWTFSVYKFFFSFWGLFSLKRPELRVKHHACARVTRLPYSACLPGPGASSRPPLVPPPPSC